MALALRLSLLALAALTPSLAYAQPTPPPQPDLNPSTPAKIDLGKALFWDEQLSSDGTVACGTCHSFATGGTDPRAGSPGSLHPGPDGIFGNGDDVWGSKGVIRQDAAGNYQGSGMFGMEPQVTRRKAPTVIAASFKDDLFWDRRATGVFHDPTTGQVVLNGLAALESQAVDPPRSDIEMSHTDTTPAHVEARLLTATPLALATNIPAALQLAIAGKTYPDLFNAAFGTPQITLARIAMAIAVYERTLIPDQAPVFFTPLPSTAAKLGGADFERAAKCATCHPSPVDTDRISHHTGVTSPDADLGVFEITPLPENIGAFATPVLVGGLDLQKKLFHDGSAASLDEVLDFYRDGGNFHTVLNQIQPIPMGTTRRANLIAYMQTFTDARVAAETAPFDRPTLYTDNPSRQPQLVGVPTPGTGDFSPRMVVIEPPYVGNTNYTIGVKNGVGGAAATLLVGLQPDPTGPLYLGVQVFVMLTPPPLVYSPPGGVLSGPAIAGGGWGSVVLPYPLPAGATFAVQWILADSGGPAGYSATEAATFSTW